MSDHLHLVPPNGGGSGPEPCDPSGPPPASDTALLEARVHLQRLARHLHFVGTATEVLANHPAVEGKIIAVFDQDALPELAGLLLREGRP